MTKMLTFKAFVRPHSEFLDWLGPGLVLLWHFLAPSMHECGLLSQEGEKHARSRPLTHNSIINQCRHSVKERLNVS